MSSEDYVNQQNLDDQSKVNNHEKIRWFSARWGDLAVSLVEGFGRLHRSVQLVLCICLLVTAIGMLTLFILVAINPLAVGSIIALITAIASSIALLLGKGSSSHKLP